LKESLYIASLLLAGTCFYGTIGTDVNLLPRYLVACLILLSGIVLFYKKFRKTSKPDWYDLILVSYCALHFISIAWSQNVPEAVFEAGKSVVLVSVFFLVRTVIASNKKLHDIYLNRINLLITVVLVLACIYQFADTMTNSQYPSPYHIKGFSSHKNLLSSFLMLLLPLNFMGVYKERGMFRTLFVVFLGLQLVNLLLLQTRAVYVGLTLSLIFFFATNLSFIKNAFSKHGKKILAGLGVVLITSLGLSYFSGFLDTLKDKADVTQFAESRSAKERVVLWKNSLELIKEKPLLGHGAGNWKIHFPRTGLGELKRASYFDAFFLRPHNDYISLFSELGVLGLLLFVLILAVPLVWYFRTDGDSRGLRMRLLAATLFGFMAVFFFDFPKERIEHQLYLALIVALISLDTAGLVKRKLPVALPGLAFSLLGVGLLVWNLYSGYQRYVGDSYVNRIFAANERGQWKKMLDLSTKSRNPFFSVDPISNPIDWFAGVSQFQLGKTNEAEDLLKRALEAHPYNHKVRNSLAGVYNRNKNYEKAIEYYEGALELNPFYDNAILNLAITNFQMGNLEKAEEWINKTTKESQQKSQLIEALRMMKNQ